jgi:signal transduction histidine kinase
MMIEDEAGVVAIEWLEQENDPSRHLQGLDYFTVWRKDSGAVLATSAGPTPGDILPRFGGPVTQPELRDVTLPGGDPGRAAGVEFNARRGVRDEEDVTEASAGPAPVADPLDSGLVQLVIAMADTVTPTLAAIRRPLFGLWCGCTVLGALTIGLVVRRGLRPLDELKMQIEALKTGVSGQRIALARQPDELKPVTDELNLLLERIEKTLTRERTLTSNVAHELRTPLAGLLCTLEVTLNRLRSPEEYRQSTEECLEIAKRLHWLVNNLLSITRIEAGNVQLQNRSLTLEHTLPEWWKPFAGRAEDRDLRVVWDLEPGSRIETDPEFLRVVVNNLFDNAVSYTPDGGTIRIEVRSPGVISVANPAADLDAATVEHVFDPFWRNGSAREEAGAHTGLGLSLAKKIVELLGGRISAQVHEPDRRFIVRMQLA